MVLAAHNEESRIAARIRELVSLVAAHPAGGEVDCGLRWVDRPYGRGAQAAATGAELSTHGRVPVRVLVQDRKLGKAMALNRARAAARHPILVFADARQTWAPEALDRLVAPFDDPSVGAVSGDLVVESAPGVMKGVGLYWRFEKWLRRTESRLDSMVSVTGCIAAVRRGLFRTLPAGTILDDVYWPLAVAMAGHRVVHEERARAFDRLPERARDEFRRKVRTLAGNFQLMTLMPAVLLPWRNRLWWQFVSHRAFRLLVPWAPGDAGCEHGRGGDVLPGGPVRPVGVLSSGHCGGLPRRGHAVPAGLGDRLVPGTERRRLDCLLGLGLWPQRPLLGQGRVRRPRTGSTRQHVKFASRSRSMSTGPLSWS